MDILGIGPLEFFFILLIALIIFGPNDMVKAGKTLGRFLRKLISMEGFQTVQKATRDMRNLPNKLMREAGLEEMEKELGNIAPPDLIGSFNLKQVKSDIEQELEHSKQQIQQGLSAWTTTPTNLKEQSDHTPAADKDTSLQPANENQ